MAVNNLLVAIVDDEPVYVNVLERLLQRTGYRTRVWAPETDVLSWMQQERPQLIVLDMQLGAMSGQALFERLQQDPATCDIPVLLCSGAPWLLQDYIARPTVGGCATIEKPFDLMQFVAIVKDLTSGTTNRPEPSMLAATS